MSNETVAIPACLLTSSFQHNLVEEMVEVTLVMWNNCPETLARKICTAKLSLRIDKMGEDPTALQDWFEEWRMELLFGLGA